MRSKTALQSLPVAFLLTIASGTAVAQGRPESEIAVSVVGQTVGTVVVTLVAGGIMLVAAPRVTDSVVERARRDPILSGVAGIGSLLAFVVVTVVLAITIIGLLLVIPLAIGFTVLQIGGGVVGAIVVGSVILDAIDEASHGMALVVGTGVVAMLNLIPILGSIALFAINVVGLGSLAMHLKEGYDDGGSGGSGSSPTWDRVDDDFTRRG